MESKKIISALAMAAVMVGCSQEEIVTQDSNLVASGNLEERPVVGNVNIGGVGVESRMAINGSHGFNVKFETGDQVGAAIIDEPILNDDISGISQGYTGYSWNYAEYLNNKNKGTEEEPVYYETAGLASKDFYNTVEYISTNYPYTRAESGKFQTQANLVEGNYMFYMPYNEGHLNRTRINAVLPQVQDCSDEVMKTATYGTGSVSSSSTVIDQFYKGTVEGAEMAPVLVGYKFLEAPKDGSIIEPSVAMTHLYAYPMITVKNDFNGYIYFDENADNIDKFGRKFQVDMVVDSVQVYFADADGKNPLYFKAPVNSDKIASILENDDEWDDKRLTEGAPTSDILDDEVVVLERTNGYAPKNTVAARAIENSNYKNHITAVIGKEVKTGDDYSFRVILPAANYGHNLKARVYVTMAVDGLGSKQYVLMEADRNAKNIGESAVVDYRYYPTEASDFTFVDQVNGGMDCELVRGQQYPKAEIREDGTALKSFAGSMMTVSLADADAFVLKEAVVAPEAVDCGIMTNEELINYLKDNVQRGVTICEYASLRTVNRNDWKTADVDSQAEGVQCSAGNLAFAENNTIIINAQLIKDLKQQTIVASESELKLTLNDAVLPIADDVKVAGVEENVYTFTTLDETVSYKIKMNAAFNANGEALTDGINNIGSTVTLKADDEVAVTNAVVMLSSSADATYSSATEGVNAIYVANGAKLKVNAECDAMIIAEQGAAIVLGSNGSLTNGNSVMTGASIINNYGNKIAGELENTIVAATYAASWPTTAIAGDSRINNVVINLSAETTAQTPLAVEQAQIDVFQNLTNVALTLGANIKHIQSAGDVELTNLMSMTGSSVVWSTTNNAGITVEAYQWGENDTDVTSVDGITANGNVTLPGTALENLLAAIEAGNDVTLQGDVALNQPLEISSDIEIDLNGKTIAYNAGSRAAANCVIKVSEGAKLNLVNGNIVSEGAGVYGLLNLGDAVVNCNITAKMSNCIQHEGKGSLTINGGTYVSELTDGQAVRMEAKSSEGKSIDAPWKLYINGGTFKSNWVALYMANNYYNLDPQGYANIRNAKFEGVISNKVTNSGGVEVFGDIVVNTARNITIENCEMSNSTIFVEFAESYNSEVNGVTISSTGNAYESIF